MALIKYKLRSDERNMDGRLQEELLYIVYILCIYVFYFCDGTIIWRTYKDSGRDRVTELNEDNLWPMLQSPLGAIRHESSQVIATHK